MAAAAAAIRGLRYSALPQFAARSSLVAGMNAAGVGAEPRRARLLPIPRSMGCRDLRPAMTEIGGAGGWRTNRGFCFYFFTASDAGG